MPMPTKTVDHAQLTPAAFAAALVSEGACDCDGTLPEAGYDCNGDCLSDADSDGICDAFETAGCTNELAINYDPTATDDDGSCNVPAFHSCTLMRTKRT